MTPDLSYDQEGENRRAKIINGMKTTTSAVHPVSVLVCAIFIRVFVVFIHEV